MYYSWEAAAEVRWSLDWMTENWQPARGLWRKLSKFIFRSVYPDKWRDLSTWNWCDLFENLPYRCVEAPAG